MHKRNILTLSTRSFSLHRMNRLDIVTTGLVPLAKTAQGATRFWEEIRRDRVGKKYKALLTGPVPVGVLEHYMPGLWCFLVVCVFPCRSVDFDFLLLLAPRPPSIPLFFATAFAQSLFTHALTPLLPLSSPSSPSLLFTQAKSSTVDPPLEPSAASRSKGGKSVKPASCPALPSHSPIWTYPPCLMPGITKKKKKKRRRNISLLQRMRSPKSPPLPPPPSPSPLPSMKWKLS